MRVLGRGSTARAPGGLQVGEGSAAAPQFWAHSALQTLQGKRPALPGSPCLGHQNDRAGAPLAHIPGRGQCFQLWWTQVRRAVGNQGVKPYMGWAHLQGISYARPHLA